MQKPRASRTRCAAVIVTLGLSVLGNSAARADAGSFDQAFSAQGEPDWLHYQAEYRDSRGLHRLEVWRDHDVRIKRRTDDRIEVYASRLGDDIRFTVGDAKRRLLTVVDRTNLMRVGMFLDWFAQGHAIAQPTGSYALASIGAVEQALDRSCTVWRLTPAPGEAAADICWDAALKLPLVIRDTGGSVRWRVTAFDTAPIAKQVFTPEDHDYAHTDMNAEITPDAD